MVVVEAVLEARAEEVRAKTDADLARLGLDARLVVRAGMPVPDILEQADAHTLLVMGKAGETFAAGDAVRLGGVAGRAVRIDRTRPTCPVTVRTPTTVSPRA